jgi:hypothetical protein
MTIAISGTNGITLDGQFNSASSMGFKNRIINGQMILDQRNAGAAVTINTAAQTYTLDRWRFFGQASDGVFTVQRSTVAPAGFTNSALITVTTADASIGSTQVYVGAQAIEGFNVADFAWGTASASVVTLSFWVRSSLTGTFSGSVKNSDGTRSYPFTYSIASADTLEYKTVTIPGDTTGTWLTNNGIGIGLSFNLGSGSSRLGTASTWAAANYDGATGSVALISTLNATWYITGVQLEKGSTATSFDYRPYGTELALCQRYYAKTFPIGTAPGNDITTSGALRGTAVTINASSQIEPAATWKFPVSMRTTPSTITLYAPGTSGHTAGQWTNDGNPGSSANARTNFAGTESTSFDNAGVLLTAGWRPIIHATADAEL